MSTPRRTEGGPHPDDPLGGVNAEMLRLVRRADPTVKAIVCLTAADGTGSIGFTGYDGDDEAMIDLILHAQAIAQAHGMDFRLMTGTSMDLGRSDLS